LPQHKACVGGVYYSATQRGKPFQPRIMGTMRWLSCALSGRAVRPAPHVMMPAGRRAA
jgi:hypothetical protein